MRIVKLDRRHTLHWRGYTHALRFTGRNQDARNVMNALTRFYGSEPWMKGENEHPWQSYRSERRDRPSFWVGVKDEKMLTLALMSKDNHVTV